MKQRRHSPEQVIREIAEGEKLLNQGHDVAEVCRQLEIGHLLSKVIHERRDRHPIDVRFASIPRHHYLHQINHRAIGGYGKVSGHRHDARISFKSFSMKSLESIRQ